MRRCLLLFPAALCLGCMPEFDEPGLVKDLRILGIRAEPPDVAPSGPVRVTVDALAVNPAAAAERLYTWELWLCTAEAGLCESAVVRLLLGRERTPLAAIRQEFVLSESLRSTALELFPAAARRELGWVPLTLELRVLEEGGPEVRGVKQLRLRDRLAAGEEPNRNPIFGSIELDGVPVREPLPIQGCNRLRLSVGYGDDGDGSQVLDAYTSRGQVNTWLSGVGPRFEVGWSPCEGGGGLGPPDLALLWLVLRDGRGGINWRELRAELADGAP